MRSLYKATEAARFRDRYAATHGADLAERVYTSRLLGADPSLVLHGGGNTSVKSVAREIDGAQVDVLYVKGSGWDLGAIEPKGFPACRLGPLRRVAELDMLSDEQMVAALRSQMLDPASPTPSVEALLHAFLRGKFVDHTHADAVLSIVDQPDGAARAREVWGDSLIFVPYVMPGFVLSRQIVQQRGELDRDHVMVLDKHGIFTWGATGEESYERMIEAVSRAEQYVQKSSTSGRHVATLEPTPAEPERRALQRAIAPVVRGALARAEDGTRFVLEWRDEPEVLALLAREDARAVTTVGTATPDHVIRTKPYPCWLGALETADTDAMRRSVEVALGRFAQSYEQYFDANVGDRTLTRLDRLPRLLTVPGVGVLTAGKTLKEARVAGDLYSHTAAIIANTLGMSGYRPVEMSDLFDVEYWSLEQAKLGKASSPGPLDRRIALITGAASGIGLASAAHFLALGAHVVLSDVDAARLEEVRAQLGKRYGVSVVAVAGSVTEPVDVARMVDGAVDSFGGLDLVLSNAGNAPGGELHTPEGDAALRASLELNFLGHQNVARAASELFLRQGVGGCLLFNASKSAFNPGANFGPYAVPKAAVVALMKQYAVDLGPHGIRANAVNADRIRTGLFTESLVAERARARGTTPDEYFRANLLHRETTGRDVAEAFGYLATAEATTGCVVTVDGGNAAAFPR